MMKNELLQQVQTLILTWFPEIQWPIFARITGNSVSVWSFSRGCKGDEIYLYLQFRYNLWWRMQTLFHVVKMALVLIRLTISSKIQIQDRRMKINVVDEVSSFSRQELIPPGNILWSLWYSCISSPLKIFGWTETSKSYMPPRALRTSRDHKTQNIGPIDLPVCRLAGTKTLSGSFRDQEWHLSPIFPCVCAFH